MKQEFNWSAFEKQLDKSTAICARGKSDIKAAIAAGKGVKFSENPDPQMGQIWKQGDDTIFMIQATGHNQYVAACLQKEYAGCHIGGIKSSMDELVRSTTAVFVANSLREYIAAGGKL